MKKIDIDIAKFVRSVNQLENTFFVDPNDSVSFGNCRNAFGLCLFSVHCAARFDPLSFACSVFFALLLASHDGEIVLFAPSHFAGSYCKITQLTLYRCHMISCGLQKQWRGGLKPYRLL